MNATAHLKPALDLGRRACPAGTLAAVGLFLTLASPSPAQVTNLTLVPAGAVWRYLDDGFDQGTAWQAIAFDDSPWASGQAQLGYGDGDERTVVGFGPDPNSKHPTTYFRHTFTLEDPSWLTGLTVRLLRDDGGVVYLNGVEVFRSNMPGGFINYWTFSATTIPNSEETVFFSATLNPALLVAGPNVVAAEIHQANFSSSDISFDLSLVATATVGPPVIALQPKDQLASPGGTATFRVRATGTPPYGYQWSFNGAEIPGATQATLRITGATAENEGRYLVTVTNALGVIASDKASLTLVNLSGDFFQVASLSAGNALALEHSSLTGDDRGGIAASFGDLLLTGDGSTARFNLADLSDPTPLGRVWDSLVSDLRTGTIYALAQDTTPLSSGGTVNALLEVDGATGVLIGNSIPLSTNIDLNGCQGCMGLFSGFGRIVLHNGSRAFSIRLPTGEVLDHGPMPSPFHQASETWAYWGVAEYFNDTPWLAYVRDPQTIVRTRVPDGLTLPLATFTNLSDMASITVSPLLNRWYFHHQGTSQFRSGNETVGFADASIAHEQQPQPPAVLAPPRDARVRQGSNATFTVLALGYPLNYQWQFNGQAIADATNQTLALTGVRGPRVGLYSVVVSNALGSVTSAPALLDVVSGGGGISAVAVFGGESNTPWNDDVRQKIESTGAFGQVDAFQVASGFPVPTLAQLQEYDAVLVYSDNGFNNDVAMGNLLADYVDAGGGLVLATFVFNGQLQGRIVSGGYLPFTLAGNNSPGGLTLVADDPSHPILTEIDSFHGGGSSYHNSPLSLTPGAAQVAHWSNGQPLVGTKEQPTGRVAGLNFFPPSSDARGDFWDARTDGARLMANALQWAGGGGGSTVPYVAPGIRTHPADATVLQGLDAQFRVRPYGTPPLTCQWFFNNTLLSGATNMTLLLTDVRTNQSGGYRAVISNTYGAVTSQVAVLTVRPTRGVAGYYTDYNPSSRGLEQSIVLASFTPLRIDDISRFDFSRLNLLLVDATSDPISQSLRLRLPAVEAWVNNGGRLVVHQRRLDTTESRASNPFLLGVDGTVFDSYYDTDINLIPPTTNLVVRGPHGALTSGSLDGTEISYTAFARRATLPAGSVSFLSAGASTSQVLAFAYGLGAGLVYYSALPLDYYLDYSSSQVSSVMRNVYVPNVLEYAATYSPSGPPVILTGPASLLVAVGSTATFSVSARGQLPLRFQWLFNGTPLPGATDNPLRLGNVSSDNAGAYSVVVSNELGVATSASATLAVVPQVSVAVFSDPRYVSAPGGPPDNVQATLRQLGHIVRPFTNLLAAVTNDIVLFPEFGNRALGSDLDDASRALLQAYVSQGGLIIVQGGYANVDFLNRVFGLSLAPAGCYTGFEFTRTSQSAGTPFAAAPRSIPANQCTYTVQLDSWPRGSLPFYTADSYGSAVTLMPYGGGALLHLGWNWSDAAPSGSQDGGWSAVLAAAVQSRGVVTAPPLVSVPLVPAGSYWRYLDNGSDQGTAWRDLAFDDNSWPAGPAQLGYGDLDEATTVSFGPDYNNKYVTTYFRHTFVLANTATVTNLVLRLRRDDGAAVYLNGIEIIRDCLQEAASFNTYALCTISDADENVFLAYSVDARLLRTGTNVLAAEIHQVNPTSSDISFDVELTGAAPAGSVAIRIQPDDRTVPAGSVVALNVVAGGQLPLSYQWRLNDQDLPEATNAILILSGVTLQQAGAYSVVVSNQLGSVLSASAQLTVITLDGDTFQIASLSTNGAGVINAQPFAGDDRGGLAASGDRIFYSGDFSTAHFSLADLSGGAGLGLVYDVLVSDLQTETVYLAAGTNAIGAEGGMVNALLELDGVTGEPTGALIPLSQPIDLGSQYGNVGLFAGLGRVVVHDGLQAWSIELPAGLVVELGSVSVPQHVYTESWAYWGVAEFFDDAIWLVYVRDSQTIVRTRVTDGFTETVASFNNLSDMAAITVSLPYNRWYFHHQYTSQFSRFYETVGFADAEFISTLPATAPTIVRQPEDQTVAASGTVALRPVVRGNGPLHYQWRFEGVALPSATNATFVLSPVTLDQAGRYSVVVSNAAGSALSSNALVTVVALAGETFRIAALSTNHPVVVDHNGLTGGARAGLAASAHQVFYTGNSGTARFDLADLSGGTNLGWVYDGLISELGTETVYVLAHGTNLFSPEDRLVTALLEVDGLSGEWTGVALPLSQPIDLRNSLEVGLFAGLGRIVVTDGTQAWTIDMPSGQVLSLGPMTVPQHLLAGMGAYWGVAEFYGGSIWLVYVRDAQTIVRTRVPDGATSVVATFANLSDMPCITVSLPFNRWYFHHQYGSQFSSFYQTLGFADAEFVSSAPTLPPSIVKPPANQTIALGGTVDFTVAVRGTAPLQYQWLFEGAPLPEATNAVLTLSGATANMAGRYSVVVSNALQAAASAEAILRVVPSVAVAVFDDPAFVYTGGDPFAGSDSVQSSLRRLGHQPAPFTSLAAAAGGSLPLLFPAFEAGDPAPTLPLATLDALQGFVVRGGVMVVHGAINDFTRPARFLNAVFGYRLQGVPANLPFFRTAQAAGTAFADGPDTLLLNTYSHGLLTSSLPAGASTIYGNSEGTAVALFRFGSGKIIFLGWNWSDAVPLGRQDGGWLTVLGSAIEETAPPLPLAPEIHEQPRNRTMLSGRAATFRVLATGYPLFYQWLFDGLPLPGETNYVLSLSSVTSDRAGLYSVVVSNALGSVTSSNAVLTVLAPLSVGVFDDARFVNTSGGPGAPADTVQATVTQLGHRAAPFTDIVTAITNQVLLFPPFEFGDPLPYLDSASRGALQSFVERGGQIIVHGLYANVTFLNALFGLSLNPYGYYGGDFYRTPQAVGTPFADGPSSLPYNYATFSVAAPSLPPLGARNLYSSGDVCVAALIPYGAGNLIYMGWNWYDAAPLGSQDNGWVETLGNALLTPLASSPTLPTFSVQPQDQTVLEGLDVSFSVGVFGSTPLQPQWFHNSQALAGETNVTLTLRSTAPDQSGEYHVVVSNLSGSVTSQVARLVVRPTRGLVGYYLDGAPFPYSLANTIERAGFTPLQILDIGAFDLSRLSLLMLDEYDGGALSPALRGRLPTIETWVTHGGKLIIHDWLGTSSSIRSNPSLLAAAGTLLVGAQGNDLEVLPPGGNLVVAGPHGVVDHGSLDGGGSSYHGYARRATLPLGTLPILGAGQDTNLVVAFSYGLGAGSIYYAAMPLDYLVDLGGSLGENVRNVYLPNVLEHSLAFTASGPPVFLTDLHDTGALLGGQAELKVGLSGQSPLFYQWFFNGDPIPGATDSTLQLAGITPARAGGYSVVASNALGAAASSVATLSVIRPTPFRIRSLTANSSQIVDHAAVTGDDRGGIGLSGTHVYYTGDSATGRFSATNLTGGTALAQRYDALVSNLRTETLYTLASDTGPVTGPGDPVTALIEIEGNTGALTTNRIALSKPIPLASETGIFAGYDAIVLHTGGQVYLMELPSGLVVDLDAMGSFPHYSCETWAYWGVAEFFDGSVHLDYVADSQTIARTRVPDGATTNLATFSNLGDMCSFTVSVPRNRWYFHHQFGAQFGGTTETLGYATVFFDQPPRLQAVPPDQVINEDSTTEPISFRVADETPASQLLLAATSSNPDLLSETNIVFGSAGVSRTVTLMPAPDQFGAALVTMKVTDAIGQSTNHSFNLTVNPVNDPPAFTPGSNQMAQANAGPQTALSWATNIRPGPANEAEQTVAFAVSNDNPGLFATQPVITPDGTLTYAPAPNADGAALVTVGLQDNGGTDFSGVDTSPAAQFTILVVPGANHPPVLQPVPTQTAYVLTPLVLSNVVIDPDVPANAFGFRLEPGSPWGARIDSDTGVFIWTPSRDQAASSNLVTVVVTDNGIPPLSATNSFSVVVGDFLELSVGSALLQPGQTGSVTVTGVSSRGVTGLSFILDAAEEQLTDFALQASAPQLSEAVLSPVTPGRFMVTLRAEDGQTFVGTNLLAHLSFAASSNQPSAFIPLAVSDVAATQDNGMPVPKTLARHGRVVIIGAAALLEAVSDANGHRTLVLYAHPGVNCVLESTPNLAEPASWQMEWQGPVTNIFHVFDLSHTNRTMFFRARE